VDKTQWYCGSQYCGRVRSRNFTWAHTTQDVQESLKTVVSVLEHLAVVSSGSDISYGVDIVQEACRPTVDVEPETVNSVNYLFIYFY